MHATPSKVTVKYSWWFSIPGGKTKAVKQGNDHRGVHKQPQQGQRQRQLLTLNAASSQTRPQIPECGSIYLLNSVLLCSSVLLYSSPVDHNSLLLAEAVGPGLGLQVVVGVPVAVEDDDGVGRGQVDAQPARARAEQEAAEAGRVLVEAVDADLPVLGRCNTARRLSTSRVGLIGIQCRNQALGFRS